jgi:hypothetical protein
VIPGPLSFVRGALVSLALVGKAFLVHPHSTDGSADVHGWGALLLWAIAACSPGIAHAEKPTVIDGDTARYLAEKLGEATSGAGIPALVLVILTLVVTNKPTACIYAGLAGSLFLPAVNLLRRRSSIPELHHHLLAPADEIVYAIISLIVGLLIGTAGYAIKRKLIKRKIDLMLRPPAREDERSPRLVSPSRIQSGG